MWLLALFCTLCAIAATALWNRWRQSPSQIDDVDVIIHPCSALSVTLRKALLKNAAHGSKVSQPMAIILVNPVAGSGRARTVVVREVVPGIESIGLKTLTFASNGPTELKEMGRCIGEVLCEMAAQMSEQAETNPGLVSAVVVAAGDGGINQVVNGMFSTWPDMSAWPALLPIPCGTGNGVAYSLGLRTPKQCIEALAERSKRTSRMDVMRIRLTEGVLHKEDNSHMPTVLPSKQKAVSRDVIALLSVMWGSGGEYDELTEDKLRNWGPAIKNIVAPLIVIWRSTRFSALLRFRPTSENPPAQRKGLDSYCSRSCPCRSLSWQGPANANGKNSRPMPWEKHDRELSLVIFNNLGRLADDALADPSFHAADALIGITTMEAGMNRLTWAYMFLAEMPSGKHLGYDPINFYNATEGDLDIRNGRMSVDGEMQPANTKRAEIAVQPLCLRIIS